MNLLDNDMITGPYTLSEEQEEQGDCKTLQGIAEGIEAQIENRRQAVGSYCL